jgi:PKD repeat protein
MVRIGAWIAAALLCTALMPSAGARAEDTQQELKQLDTLQGYNQLPDEKSVKKDIAVPNQPIESFIVWSEANPTKGVAPLKVAFTADPPSGVPDPVYSWQFGDGGAPANGQSVSHVFDKPGIYKVILKVTNAAGALGEEELRIKVTQ